VSRGQGRARTAACPRARAVRVGGAQRDGRGSGRRRAFSRLGQQARQRSEVRWGAFVRAAMGGGESACAHAKHAEGPPPALSRPPQHLHGGGGDGDRGLGREPRPPAGEGAPRAPAFRQGARAQRPASVEQTVEAEGQACRPM
jgi:hypothetical protein